MNLKEIEDIKKKIKQILVAFGQDHSTGTLALYLVTLAKHDFREVSDAIDRSLVETTGLYRPACIMGALGGANLSDKASKQSESVRKLLSYKDDPEFYDPITARIMTVYLPYSDWRSRQKDEIDKFFHPQFVKKYREIIKNPDEMKNAGDNSKAIAPKIPDNPVVVSKNKAFLVAQMEHNDHDFQLYPSGAEGFNSIENATGFWVCKYTEPVMFGDVDFEKKFEDHLSDERFVIQWDFDKKNQKMKRWTVEKQHVWDRIVTSKNEPKRRGALTLKQLLDGETA